MVDQTTGSWWEDDDRLLAALDRAMHPTVDVPVSFVHAAQACYGWHLIDSELAALAYDSAFDTMALAVTRAEPATLRALTFEATNLTFELEVMPDGLAGQLIPPQTGQLQVLTADGRPADVRTDRSGYFRIRPAPDGPFRLRCRLGSGRLVTTDVITL